MILKLLIVEDEEIIRKGLVSTINWIEMGCSVVGSAADGREGLKMILEMKPDIVITDIRMPGMSGIEMLAAAEKEVHFRSIILTSYAEFEYAQRAIELRTYEYLLKPLDEEKLNSVIQKIRHDVEQEAKLQRLDQLKGEPELLQPLGIKSSGDPLVDYAIDRITNGSSERLNAEMIANEMFVSPSYLSRRLKAVTGRTFLELLSQYRVQQAISLINGGVTDIPDIVEKTGFGDEKHFYNVFKRYTGLSPREYMNVKKP